MENGHFQFRPGKSFCYKTQILIFVTWMRNRDELLKKILPGFEMITYVKKKTPE